MNEKLVVIPFSYPFYPKEIIGEQINRAKKLLGELSPVFLDAVFVQDDIEKTKNKIRQLNPDLIIAMIVSWVEAPNFIDTMKDYFGKPILLWSHTTFQLNNKKQTVGAFVAAGVIKQTLEDFEVPFEFIYGKPDDKNIVEKTKKFYAAAKAIAKLKDTKIGLVGYPALGMYTGTIDHITLKKKFGPEIIHLDQYQIINKVDNLNDENVKDEKEYLKSRTNFAKGINDELIDKSAKMYHALKSLVNENKLDAITVKCQYELSQIYKFTPCVSLSLLGEEIPTSCEGDMQTILSQVILHYLSGSIVTYGDIHEVLDERILAGACGFSPFSMSDKKDCLVCEWGWEAFSGVLNSSQLKKGKMTLARFSRDGSGFKLHLATGESVGRSDWNEVDCPPYPGTDIILDGSTENFAQELVSNHYAMIFGNVTEELRLFCKWLNIRYILT
jgi:L-fucose isomerase-like protein